MSGHKYTRSYDLREGGLLPIVEEETSHVNGVNGDSKAAPILGCPKSASVLSSSPPSITHLARRFGRALLPSFLASRASHSDGSTPAQHGSTLYLDGLRGYAAICVLNSHVVTAFTNAPQVDWGWGEGQYLTPTSLPVIRLLFSGPGMVTLFFLVSGFSCSLKPLEGMQKNNDPTEQARVLKNLSGSLMRRWFRLYLPVLACTLLVNLWVFMGGFNLMPYYLEDENLLHPPQRYVAKWPTFWLQTKFWFLDMYELLNLWHVWPNGSDAGYYAPYSNPHMWFITVEFKASLVLYCSLLALAIAKPGPRFAALVAFAGYMFFACKDEILPYFIGACLASVKLMIDNHRSEKGTSNILVDLTGVTHGLADFAWNTYLLISVWLMSTPAWSYQGPSYYVFAKLTPGMFVRQQTLMQLMGVAGLLLCLMTSSPNSRVQRFLTNRYALYLGRISFAVYIVHGPVLLSFGYVVPIWVFRNFGTGPIGFTLGLVAAEIVNIFISVWIADVFQREVEQRCIRLTKWMEQKVTGR